MDSVSDSVFDIHQADARNLRPELNQIFGTTKNLVDTIITSPPYGDMQHYGDHKDQIGEQSYEDFLADLRLIFKQCYEVASDESTLWTITDTFRRNNRLVRPPFDIADELENLENRKFCPNDTCNGRLQRDRGTGILSCDICEEELNPLLESWRLNDQLIWNKRRTRPWRKKGQLRNIYEYISMYTKSEDFKYNADDVRIKDIDSFGRWWVDYPERYHPEGKLPDNIWEMSIPKQGEWGPKLSYHPSPFPEQLVERIIKLSTDPGDIVLDPFAGVGSTLAVAYRLDRRPIGFELNEKFIDYYHDHVLPTVGRPKTEQQKLIDNDSGPSLEYLIWTLRIHKYAFRLQRQLVTNDEIDIRRKDLTAMFALTDRSTMDAETPPKTQLYYLGAEQLANLSNEFDTAIDAMTSDERGSGDYYEVDFELEAYFIDNWFEEVAINSIKPSALDQLYVYPNGIHHWYQTELTFSKWQSLVEKSEWKRYQSATWSPLVSNLAIQIENPLEEVNIETDKDQSILDSFFTEE